MSYNIALVNGSNVTNMLQVTQRVNDASNHLFGTLLMAAIFIGIYFMYKKEETLKDLFASTFIGIIIGVLFILLNLITWQIFIAFVFVFVIIFMLNFFT